MPAPNCTFHRFRIPAKTTCNGHVAELAYFRAMLMTPGIIKAMLSHLRIDDLNELQTAALAAGQDDHDLILLSDTGSGKTIAFLLPVLAAIQEQQAGTQAMVIVPSRE